MTGLPSGTVTFLFTDVEGSTRLLAELGPERYAEALAAHRRALRGSFKAHGGVEVDAPGDAFFVAFARAADAVAAAVQARAALGADVLVRMGIHSGEPFLTDEGYVGMDVHRAARIAAVGHGGQILVSQSTRELVPDADLRDLGEHRLKDLTRAERIWQLGEGEFPPLASLHRTRLPVAAAPLIGREAELARIEDELRSGTRLLTVTGAGGSGKTRLALQAAAELTDEFVGGTYFVALAPLSDAGAVQAAVARALELQPDDDVLERLRSSRALLVLDNAEHLAAVEHEVGKLRVGDTALLVTSRRPLHLSGERELPLDPLPDDAAVELLLARVIARGRRVAVDDTLRAICRRLDNLPLAIELAASRLTVLSPSALLERLDLALPLLTVGARDADERQRTLRATIEWSFHLLGERGQDALRRLAIFRGGFTLEAAEAVADADLDVLTELVDQSLLKRTDDDRYLMLETIREFGLEDVDADLVAAHAQYYLDRVRANEHDLRGLRMNEHLAWFRADGDNVWAALDALLAAGREDEAWELAILLAFYCGATGTHRRCAEWLEHALPKATARTPAWICALVKRGQSLANLGSPDEARIVLAEAEPHAVASGDDRCLFELYRAQGLVALYTGEPRTSEPLYRRALEHASRLDARSLFTAQHALGAVLFELGRHAEAEALVYAARAGMAEIGDVFYVANSLNLLAMIEFELGRDSEACAHLEAAASAAVASGSPHAVCMYTTTRGFFALARGRFDEARLAFGEVLRLAVENELDYQLGEVVEYIAVLSAADDPAAAGNLYVTVGARRADRGLPRQQRDSVVYDSVLAGRELSGEIIPWDEAVALAQSLVQRNLD